jgi:hypothetical protein
MKKKFKKGDRVIGKGTVIGCRIDGKVGTVIGFDKYTYAVQFDENIGGHNCGGCIKGVEGESGHCWWCGEEDLELIKNPDKLIFKGKETILIKDGKEYVSKCADGDVYDKEKGVLLCLARANGVSYTDLRTMIDTASCEPTDEQAKAIKEIAEQMKVFFEAGFKALKDKDNANAKPEAEKTVKEVKRPAKVGEYIKIVRADAAHDTYKNGDILRVYKEHSGFGNGVFCEMTKKVCAPAFSDNGNIIIWNREYVVLENYKPYKITLSEFWKSKDELAIHCKTEDEAKELLKAFDKAGKRWRSGTRYTEKTRWGEYKENTTYANDNGYEDVEYSKRNEHKIFEFNEVDLNN